MRADFIAPLRSFGPVALIEDTDTHLPPDRWPPQHTAPGPTSWTSRRSHVNDLHIGRTGTEWLRQKGRGRRRSIASCCHRACSLCRAPQTAAPVVAHAIARTCGQSIPCKHPPDIAPDCYPELLDPLIAAIPGQLAGAIGAFDVARNRRGSRSTAKRIRKP